MIPLTPLLSFFQSLQLTYSLLKPSSAVACIDLFSVDSLFFYILWIYNPKNHAVCYLACSPFLSQKVINFSNGKILAWLEWLRSFSLRPHHPGWIRSWWGKSTFKPLIISSIYIFFSDICPLFLSSFFFYYYLLTVFSYLFFSDSEVYIWLSGISGPL